MFGVWGLMFDVQLRRTRVLRFLFVFVVTDSDLTWLRYHRLPLVTSLSRPYDMPHGYVFHVVRSRGAVSVVLPHPRLVCRAGYIRSCFLPPQTARK